MGEMRQEVYLQKADEGACRYPQRKEQIVCSLFCSNHIDKHMINDALTS